jgi:hypothetical protein
VSSWALKEGVREIVQNLMDAVTLYAISHGGHKDDIAIRIKDRRISDQRFREYEFIFQEQVIGQIEYNHILRTLQCSNPGRIPIEAILLGGTEKNKMQSLEVIGRFGEGMKLAALALLREGKTFLIKTGGQVWTFFLKEDSTFKHICLHFSIVGLAQKVEAATTSTPEAPNNNNNNVIVTETTVAEIGNLSIEEWNENIKHFLDLTDETLCSVPGSDRTMGEVLLGAKLRGRLFVKGLHVQDLMDELHYGFNLITIDLDRDRRCIPNVWDRYRLTSQLLANVQNNRTENQLNCPEAITALNEMLYKIYDLLAEGHGEVWFFHEYVSVQLADELFSIFQSKLQAAGKNAEAMPIIPGLDNAVEKQMKDQHITSSVYPYETCSWMLYYTLIKSTSHYRTLEQRIDHYLSNTPIYQPTQPEQEIVNRVIDKIKLIEPSFAGERIIFKAISYQLFFAAQNNIYLSKELLQQHEVQRHESNWLVSSQHLRECKIFVVCTQLLGISPFAALTHNVTFFSG